MNVFFGTGRLTADPIIGVASGSGTSVARYTLAIPRCLSGEQQITDFVRCKAFGKSADFAAKYLRKGQRVAVRGSLEVSKYEKDVHRKRWWRSSSASRSSATRPARSRKNRTTTAIFRNRWRR